MTWTACLVSMKMSSDPGVGDVEPELWHPVSLAP